MKRSWKLLPFILALLLGACRVSASDEQLTTMPVPDVLESAPSPTPGGRAAAEIGQPPTPYTPSSLPTETPTFTPEPPAWLPLVPGLSRATVWAPAPDEDFEVPVLVIRADPALVTFQVHYNADDPQVIGDWRGRLAADVVINGGFYSGDHRPVGRMVIDGELYGYPFGTQERIGTPGIFAVLEDDASIFALGYADYTPRGLRFEEAIESYPVLLLPGRTVAYPPPPLDDPGRRARRTVIGLDSSGRVVMFVVDQSIFTLYELATWIAASNLNLDTALNLDGGRSSGMIVQTGGVEEIIPSYVPLPIVLAITQR